ncbi:MAG: hypothetical protein RL328_1560 [Acidobacteriota bacterium]
MILKDPTLRSARLLTFTFAAFLAAAIIFVPSAPGQAGKGGKGGGGKGGAPKGKQVARTSAPIDLTGTWVSVVTEDWMFRMVTPPKGEMLGVPVTGAARAAANAWDPAADEAAGNQCKAYAAPGVMRQPGRIRVSWQDDSTLKVETEAGTQTRLFNFGAPPAAGERSWQGISTAQWETAVRAAGQPPAGNLKVVTTNLKPGYVRKNGVPYSADAVLTEYYDVHTADNKDVWMVVTTQVHDPANFTTDFITSSHFKKLGTGAPWKPEACSAR